jgi:glycosyltransferase involved in cell wall biosynthesis
MTAPETLFDDSRDGCGHPEISLIVNTFMKPGHLARVLESIRHQRVAGRFELIVSDDGSTDATRNIVEDFARSVDFGVAFVSRPHEGFRLAAVRNAGARLATGRRLLFLDGDCVLPRDHVAAHIACCRHGVAAVGYCARLDERASERLDPATLEPESIARIVPASEQRALRQRLRRWRWHQWIRHPSKPRLTGGNVSVDRDDFWRVNGFDERFVGWGQEDDDLGLRLRAAGVRLDSILGRTYSLHLWHPPDTTATRRWRDGPNVAYFERRGRLTRCRRGLEDIPLAGLRWRLGGALGESPLGRQLAGRLVAEEAAATAEPAEAELQLLTPLGPPPRWASGALRAECRVLVAAGGQRDHRACRGADVVIEGFTTEQSTPSSATEVLAKIDDRL